MDAKMKVERAAAGAAIDGVLKYVNHGDDRTKALLNLTDFVQKFTGNMFAEKTFDNIRTMLQNPDNKWVQYVNRGLDELDPQVIKMTALNLGFQAAFVWIKSVSPASSSFFRRRVTLTVSVLSSIKLSDSHRCIISISRLTAFPLFSRRDCRMRHSFFVSSIRFPR